MDTTDSEKMKVEEVEFTGSQKSLVAAEQKDRQRATHSPLHIALVALMCVLFCVVMFFNYYNNMADGVVFLNTIGGTSDFFYFEVTPAGWAFSIWGVIYFMQVAFLVYCVACLFRKTSHGPLYLTHIPLMVYIIYSLNLVVNIAWLFAFDRKEIVISLCVLVCIPATIIACMVFSFVFNTEIVRFFKKENQRYEMILLNVFVYNAWAIYLGWTICASLLNFGFMLVYSANVAQEAAGIATLTILLLIILVVCPLELTILDKYLRYVVLHYLGPLMALAGSVSKAGSNDKGIVPSGVNRTYAAVILGILLLFIVLKAINLGIRAWKQPLYYDNGCQNKAEKPEKSPEV